VPLLIAALLSACATAPPASVSPISVELPELAQQVEIRRTQHGVPHILAENLPAGAFALAWVQLEDHGPRIIEGMNAARGHAALVRGEALIDADAGARLRRNRAEAVFDLLEQDTRERPMAWRPLHVSSGRWMDTRWCTAPTPSRTSTGTVPASSIARASSGCA
jgi:acyl-homoserine lactone acylase PvdQ